MSFDFFSVLQPHTKTKRIQTPFQVFAIIFFFVQMWNVITTTYQCCCCHLNILMSFIFFAEKKKERDRERKKQNDDGGGYGYINDDTSSTLSNTCIFPPFSFPFLLTTYRPHPCFLKSFIFVVASVRPKNFKPPRAVISPPLLSSI